MPREIENAESAAEVRSGSRRSELTELIDYIRGKIEAEEEKIKETPWGGDRELSVCLGYCPENPGMAIVVRKHGVFLENAMGIVIEKQESAFDGGRGEEARKRFEELKHFSRPISVGKDELEKYKEVINHTIYISIKDKKPLGTKYRKKFEADALTTPACESRYSSASSGGL